MAYNSEKHHCRSTRLKDYDYGEAGAYFVTVCIEHRECLLGDVVDGQMTVSSWGLVAGEVWEQIAEHWPMVDLDASVIMPNHMHGIVIIREEEGVAPALDAETGEEGGGTPPLQGQAKPTLGAIIAYWKCQTSKQINAARETPGTRIWQRNYYDRIIRSEEMLDKARTYLTYNPARWGKDADNRINQPSS